MVSQEFDLELPSTLVFDHPTINAIAELVMSRSSRAGDPAGGDVLRLRPRQGDNDNDGGLAVAIASVSASYPMSRDLDQLLTGCQDVQRAVPLERWDVEAHYSVGADGMYARFGAFFEDITMFDAPLFSMSQAQGAFVDPQQRMLLEGVARPRGAVSAILAYRPRPRTLPHKLLHM